MSRCKSAAFGLAAILIMLVNSCCLPISADEQKTVLQGGVTKNKSLEEEPTVNAGSSDLISGVVYGNVENRRIRERKDILVIQVKDPEGDAARNAAIFGMVMSGIGAAASAANSYSNSGGGYTTRRSSGGGYSRSCGSGSSYSSGGGSSGSGMGGCQ